MCRWSSALSLFLSRYRAQRQIPAINGVRFPSFERVNETLVRGSSSTISFMSQIEERNPMPTTRYRQVAANVTPRLPVSRLHQNRPFHHTHVQQVAECIHVHVSGVAGC